MVGVPKAQRRQVESHYAGAIVAFVQDCVDAVFGRLRLSDNYFWRVYLTGRYTLVHAPVRPRVSQAGQWRFETLGLVESSARLPYLPFRAPYYRFVGRKPEKSASVAALPSEEGSEQSRKRDGHRLDG